MPARCRRRSHILDENEIVDGIDELGVLLYGHGKNAYWYGSQLSIEETRELAPYQNATGLQVTSAVLAGMVWALENPNAGIVEADEMDFRRCLEVQMPYLGPVNGTYTDWTPLDRPARAASRRTSTRAIPGSSGTCWCADHQSTKWPEFPAIFLRDAKKDDPERPGIRWRAGPQQYLGWSKAFATADTKSTKARTLAG